MVLTIYSDFASQPCRAVVLFARVNKIPHEVKNIVLAKGEHKTEEMKQINPKSAVPFIDDDGFTLSESVAIIKYLATQYKVDDHWYPLDVKQRARVEEAVAWQHSALSSPREFGCGLAINKVFRPLFAGVSVDEEKFKKDSEGLNNCLKTLEEFFLKDTPFMSSSDVTVADLLCTNELMQTKLVSLSILDEHPKVMDYIERVRQKTNPFWDEIFGEAQKKYDTFLAQLQSRQ